MGVVYDVLHALGVEQFVLAMVNGVTFELTDQNEREPFKSGREVESVGDGRDGGIGVGWLIVNERKMEMSSFVQSKRKLALSRLAWQGKRGRGEGGEENSGRERVGRRRRNLGRNLRDWRHSGGKWYCGIF